jgi:hypothetical protein
VKEKIVCVALAGSTLHLPQLKLQRIVRHFIERLSQILEKSTKNQCTNDERKLDMGQNQFKSDPLSELRPFEFRNFAFSLLEIP